MLCVYLENKPSHFNSQQNKQNTGIYLKSDKFTEYLGFFVISSSKYVCL
jgi:hypothetical protein